MKPLARSIVVALLLASGSSLAQAAPGDYFAIHVLDDATGRGVPAVELSTTYAGRYVTDSAGYVAFLEPGLMTGDDVWFDVKSYGYESPPGAFGMRGIAFKPIAGKSVELRLKRTNLAERLYRVTGYGIYRDSVLLGKSTPIREPLLNARVTGQDTVQTAIYRGTYLWLWQDTSRLGFALGGFSMTGATAPLPDKVDVDHGIDFTYFVDKPGEFARAMADVPRKGSSPLWCDGITVVKDAKGEERMIGRYVSVDPTMRPIETGLIVYDDARQIFVRLKRFDGDGDGTRTAAPSGRPYRVIDHGKHYVCYPGGVRVLADFEHASDPANYDAFTCLKNGASDEANDAGVVDRAANGNLRWRWQRGASPLRAERIDKLVKGKAIRADELPVQFRDVESGKPVRLAGGSIAWSPYLKRWTYVFGESMGASTVGECWIATANSPDGPWIAARKIATHAMPKANYDLYNVVQHDELARGDGRYVYFEGTFVNTFSGNPAAVPYYNYNNLMYRLDLADERLKLPDPPAGWTDVSPEP